MWAHSGNWSSQILKTGQVFSQIILQNWLAASVHVKKEVGINTCRQLLIIQDISFNGTFALGRQEEEHRIRISWEKETQLLCPPGWKFLKHTLKQKQRQIRIFMSKPLLPTAFKHTRGYWWISVWYFRHITVAYHQFQVSAFCEFGPKFFIRKPSSKACWITEFFEAPFKKVLPTLAIANYVVYFVVSYLSIAFRYKQNTQYFNWYEILISFILFVKVPDVQLDLSSVFGHQETEKKTWSIVRFTELNT